MAKLTKLDINKIKYVSMNDYLSNVSKLNNLEDKIKYTTRYLLNHDGYEDYTLEEAIHIAREKIADEMIKSKESNLQANKFINNPIQYIKDEANKLASELEEEDALLKSEENLKSKCISIANYMDYREMENKLNNVNNSKNFNLKVRLSNNFGGKREITNTLNATKPSFIRSFFTKDSNEWNNLNRIYEGFNDPKSEFYGNLDALKDATKNYITHKFPNYKEGDIIPDEAINGLEKRSKSKMIFSLNVLKSINEQKEIDKNYKEALDKASNEKDIVHNNKVIDLDQSDFQNNLNNDSFDNSIENNEIEESLDAQNLKSEIEIKSEAKEEIDINK